jgi:succinate dehydrogenase/fumarate reductase flavoprotein subunit
MKYAFLIPLAAATVAASGYAQNSPTIFRCSGNVYTNNVAEARAKGCKPMEGGNITVVEGTRVNGNAAVRVATAPQSASSPRVDADGQRARDADARAILEAELKKAEARQAELLKEYNNGEPEKMGPEHRNYQKYLDRVAELKASIARNETDIAGIKRELSRVPSK